MSLGMHALSLIGDLKSSKDSPNHQIKNLTKVSRYMVCKDCTTSDTMAFGNSCNIQTQSTIKGLQTLGTTIIIHTHTLACLTVYDMTATMALVPRG